MSTLKVTTLQNLSGTEVYTAKAWVNFNGTGTVAIRAAGNVSSITDNGTGDYTVNFTTAFADANYAINGVAGTPASLYGTFQIYSTAGTSPSTTSFRFTTVGSGWTVGDMTIVSISIFR
jgi:hypothetical protein